MFVTLHKIDPNISCLGTDIFITLPMLYNLCYLKYVLIHKRIYTHIYLNILTKLICSWGYLTTRILLSFVYVTPVYTVINLYHFKRLQTTWTSDHSIILTPIQLYLYQVQQVPDVDVFHDCGIEPHQPAHLGALFTFWENGNKFGKIIVRIFWNTINNVLLVAFVLIIAYVSNFKQMNMKDTSFQRKSKLPLMQTD